MKTFADLHPGDYVYVFIPHPCIIQKLRIQEKLEYTSPSMGNDITLVLENSDRIYVDPSLVGEKNIFADEKAAKLYRESFMLAQTAYSKDNTETKVKTFGHLNIYDKLYIVEAKSDQIKEYNIDEINAKNQKIKLNYNQYKWIKVDISADQYNWIDGEIVFTTREVAEQHLKERQTIPDFSKIGITHDELRSRLVDISKAINTVLIDITNHK
jgi:hypothetical protein